MSDRYNVNIRWRINNHWGISAIGSAEGCVEVAILSFRNYSSGQWGSFNDHGFVDNNFPLHRNFLLDLIPTLVGWLRYKLKDEYDYLEIVNVECGRDVFTEFLEYEQITYPHNEDSL